MHMKSLWQDITYKTLKSTFVFWGPYQCAGNKVSTVSYPTRKHSDFEPTFIVTKTAFIKSSGTSDSEFFCHVFRDVRVRKDTATCYTFNINSIPIKGKRETSAVTLLLRIIELRDDTLSTLRQVHEFFKRQNMKCDNYIKIIKMM